MIHTITLIQYVEMWNRIIRWQKKTGEKRIPNYVDISDFKIKDVPKIIKTQIIDMESRVQNWKNSHNGAMPNIIGIEGPAPGTEPRKIGSIQSYAIKQLGYFSTITGFCDLIRGRGYKKYYNDIKTRIQTIDAIASNDEEDNPNCTDAMQVLHDLAIEMGYECRYVHVQCKEGGHIRGQIKGHEFKEWTRIDPAAILSKYTRAKIGEVWCDYVNAHIEDAPWLNLDDGR